MNSTPGRVGVLFGDASSIGLGSTIISLLNDTNDYSVMNFYVQLNVGSSTNIQVFAKQSLLGNLFFYTVYNSYLSHYFMYRTATGSPWTTAQLFRCYCNSTHDQFAIDVIPTGHTVYSFDADECFRLAVIDNGSLNNVIIFGDTYCGGVLPGDTTFTGYLLSAHSIGNGNYEYWADHYVLNAPVGSTQIATSMSNLLRLLSDISLV